MPMGFYQPAQIVIDARKHGVEVRPVDVNYSYWDNVFEEQSGNYYAIRLGFRQVKALRQDDMEILIAGRTDLYNNIPELRNAGVPHAALERLADADAFRSIELDRRRALWEVAALHDRPVALFSGQKAESEAEAQIKLPLMSEPEHVMHDYATTALSLKGHPVSFVREKLQLLHVLSAKEITTAKEGSIVRVSGLVLVRQRPGTAGGVCFITIEDETGFSNLVIFQNLFEKYRKEILQARLLMAEGKLQREGDVIHVIVQRCFDLTKLLRGLSKPEPTEKEKNPFPAENKRTQVRQTTQKEVFPTARNFK
jgi:error-prone DNA polymerase